MDSKAAQLRRRATDFALRVVAKDGKEKQSTIDNWQSKS
jgi:hypothetical protein